MSVPAAIFQMTCCAAWRSPAPPSDIAEQTASLFEAGVHRVEYGTPHGLTAAEGLRLLGEQVLPALKRTYDLEDG